MSRLMFSIFGFLLLILRSVYGEYCNDTESLNSKRESRRIRRNKFITFDTTDTDIEVAFQFNVPFVAVPTDRSISNVTNPIASFANLNLGSVTLAGAMIVFGSVTSFLWKTLMQTSKTNPNNNSDNDIDIGIDNDNETTNNSTTEDMNTEDMRTEDVKTDDMKSERANEDNKFMKLMYLLEETAQTTINPTICLQKFFCSISRTSAQNVASGYGSSTDKILDGIFSANWILDTIHGSAIHDAIRYGEITNNCSEKFQPCGFTGMNLDILFNMLLRYTNIMK